MLDDELDLGKTIVFIDRQPKGSLNHTGQGLYRIELNGLQRGPGDPHAGFGVFAPNQFLRHHLTVVTEQRRREALAPNLSLQQSRAIEG